MKNGNGTGSSRASCSRGRREHGFLGMAVPERYGGAGVADFRFNIIIGEEVRSRPASAASASGSTLHNDICLPYFLTYCDEAQRERWLPGIADGTLIRRSR